MFCDAFVDGEIAIRNQFWAVNIKSAHKIARIIRCSVLKAISVNKTENSLPKLGKKLFD